MPSFSHLVEINDLLNPLLEPLSREQLWRGLVCRAEEPLVFVAGPDTCRIHSRGEQSLRRELHFGEVCLGEVVVRDSVHFTPLESVRYKVGAGADYPGSTLTMRIEEPGPGHLFVRFEYADERPDAMSGDVQALKYRHSVYLATDLETIRGIRKLAAEGRLGVGLGVGLGVSNWSRH